MEVLTAIGAKYVANSSLTSFEEDILTTVKSTRAPVVFDATGGGTLALDMLNSSTHQARERHLEERTNDELGPCARRHHKCSSDDLPPPAAGRQGC